MTRKPKPPPDPADVCQCGCVVPRGYGMVDADTGLFWRLEHWLKRFAKPYLDEPGDFVQQLDSEMRG